LLETTATWQDFLHASALRQSGINPEALVGGETRLEYEMVEDPDDNKFKATDIKILD
jgi:hypothetical protein